jgi:hypothetical protein
MKLEEWFEDGCPYQQGVELYAELGTNKALKTMLGFGETKYNARKLYEALQELQQTANLKKDQEQATEQKKKEATAAQDPRLLELYRERNVIHTLLSETPSESDRKRQAFKILSITDKVERILGVQEEIPVKANTLPNNPLELIKRRNNNRSYISKKKNQEKSPGEVQRRKDENEEIESILNNEAVEKPGNKLNNKQLLISVIGNIASGKTTLCKKIAEKFNVQCIEVNEKYKITKPVVLFESSGISWKLNNATRRFSKVITIMVECGKDKTFERLEMRKNSEYKYPRNEMAPKEFYFSLLPQISKLKYDIKYDSEKGSIAPVFNFIDKAIGQ